MISKDKNIKYEVTNSKRVQLHSLEEIHLERTISSEKGLLKIGRWKLDNSSGEWRSCGGFSINTDTFSIFLRELILFYLSVQKQRKVRFLSCRDPNN